jgi:predicted RND superfamily exporter protein
MLRDHIFDALTRLASSRGRIIVYLLVFLLTTVSLILLPRLEIQTTRQGMVSDDLPVQAAFNDYMNDFGSPTQLVCMLEGEPDRVKAAADAVAGRLTADPRWVRNVFYRVDLDAFRRAGLYYLTREQLEAMHDYIAADPQRTALLLADRDLAGLLELLLRETGGTGLESIEHPAFSMATDLLDRWREFLENGAPPPGPDLFSSLEALAADMQGAYSWIDRDGYMLTEDRHAAFLFIQQAAKTDEASFIVPFMTHMRGETARTLLDFPGVTAGFTGWPAAIEEDYALLVTDLPRVSAFAAILILTIFIIAFRSLHRTILVFIPLVCGIIWNLALTLYTVGHLNFLSSVFVGILFGLGIDFGIYFTRRFDEERARGAEPREAIHRTFRTAGQGIITGGITAVVAFLAIGFTDQPAFSELGIVAGTGVASVLLATILLLPPLLVQFPPGMKRVDKEVASPLLEKSARLLLARPAVPLTLALAVLALAVWKMPGVGFDYNLNNLLPADSETLEVLRKMEQGSHFSDQFIAVVADDLDQVRRLHKALLEKETVSHVESLAPAIPEEAEAKRPLLGEIAALLPAAGQGRRSSRLDAVADQVDRIIERLDQAEEDAFAAGQTGALQAVDDLRQRFLAIGNLLAAPGAADRQAAFEEELFDQRDRLRARLDQMLAADPITLETLDPGVRDRLLGASGRMAVLAFASEPIWDPVFLNRLMDDARGIAAQVFGDEDRPDRVTGFAATYAVTVPMIRRGFSQSTWAAGIVVLLMLVIDLRRLRQVLTALIPLVFMAAGLLGGMALLGVKLTMATQVAFPILFGLGVAYGVHMVHRAGEANGTDLPLAVGTTGKAISLAAITTMAGFGSLMLARHTALISFGAILTAGILISALAALYVIPLVLKVLSRFGGGKR